jgi:hypothetical protein
MRRAGAFHLVAAGLLGLVLLSPRESAAAWPTDPLVNVPLCTASGNKYYPRATSDGAGGAIVAWHDYRSGMAHLYAQHVLASGAVDPAWPADGRALCAPAYDEKAAAIVVDGSGGAVVAWMDSRSGTNTDTYAQHVLADGAVDPAWPSNGRALCIAAGNQSSPRIVADGAGGAIATWADYRSGTENPDIYAQHVLAGGTVDPAWPADGRALCTAADYQQYPIPVSDGSGGVIVTWYDYRSGTSHDIYAQHVLAGGTVDPAWPADGRALCTAVNNQTAPAISADGAGGAIVAWWDMRGGSGDIYAQHVLAGGAADPAWPADGRALCTATGNQYSPMIVADGAGGAVVTWWDTRGGSGDVYAQHVRAGGTVDAAWPADGRALCTAGDNQEYPAIVGLGPGGAIVAWMDARSGSHFDVYAQYVRPDGQLGGDVAGVPSAAPLAFALEPVRPNPSRGGALSVRFTLASAGGASLELLDVAGRRLAARDVGSLGAGRHALDLGEGRLLPPGIYLVRLRQGAGTRVTRVAVLR